MLGIVAALASALGMPRWLVGIVGIIGISATLYWGVPWAWNHWIAEPYRQEGRVEVQKRWDAAVIAERDRVAKAVAEAQAEAQKTIDALEKREEELNAELIALAGEAANDTNAKSCGMSRDGVRRHKRLWKN